MSRGTSRFARLVNIKVRPGKEKDFLRIFERQILPSALKEVGLRRLYLLRPLESSVEFATFSLWDSQKDAEEYVNSGHYKGYVDKLDRLLDGEPMVSKFRIELHEVGRSVRSSRKTKKT